MCPGLPGIRVPTPPPPTSLSCPPEAGPRCGPRCVTPATALSLSEPRILAWNIRASARLCPGPSRKRAELAGRALPSLWGPARGRRAARGDLPAAVAPPAAAARVWPALSLSLCRLGPSQAAGVTFKELSLPFHRPRAPRPGGRPSDARGHLGPGVAALAVPCPRRPRRPARPRPRGPTGWRVRPSTLEAPNPGDPAQPGRPRHLVTSPPGGHLLDSPSPGFQMLLWPGGHFVRAGGRAGTGPLPGGAHTGDPGRVPSPPRGGGGWSEQGGGRARRPGSLWALGRPGMRAPGLKIPRAPPGPSNVTRVSATGPDPK